MTNQIDHMTEQGAKDLSYKIRFYWAQQGYYITTEVVRVRVASSHNGKSAYGVKSNLINGLPRDHRGFNV
jgi:hypothetical protein